MQSITFNMAQTLAIAIVVLLLGRAVKKKVGFFEKYFIPAPVIGGVIFSLLILVGYQTKMFEFKFDSSLKDLLMIAFFTTIGFQASLKTLKKGGVQVATFLFVATLLVILQNVLGVSLAKVFGLHPLLGVAAGSIPLTGGHGTAGAFGPVLEAAGATGAFTVAIASATYGLVSGCMIGGPIAKRLMNKFNLKYTAEEGEKVIVSEEEKLQVSEHTMFTAIVMIAICMGIGSYVGPLLQMISPKIVLPAYIGGMLIAAVMRNVMDSKEARIPFVEIDIIGNISLSLFLAMALMTLKLWELAPLAGPLVIILLIQTVLMAGFAYFVTFNVMGRDYDAAVITTGHCGFGMGATPNAIANMESFTQVNGPSVKAFFVLPIVGAMFIDFTNAAIITMFVNMFGN